MLPECKRSQLFIGHLSSGKTIAGFFFFFPAAVPRLHWKLFSMTEPAQHQACVSETWAELEAHWGWVEVLKHKLVRHRLWVNECYQRSPHSLS